MAIMQRTFRTWRRPWWRWRSLADRRGRLEEGANTPVQIFDDVDGLYVDFDDPRFLRQVSDGTVLVFDDGDPVGWAQSNDGDSNVLLQPTAASRPAWKAIGAILGDGTADHLISDVVGAAAGNSAFAKFTVPSLASTAIVVGFQATTNERFYLAVDGAERVCAGVGTDSAGTIIHATGQLGETGVGGITEDGSDVSLWWQGEKVFTKARAGTPSVSVPHRVGAMNNNGVAANFFPGNIFKVFVAQRGLTDDEAVALSAFMA